MKILLLYATTGGSTGKLSRALSSHFTRDGHTVSQVNIGMLERIDPAMFRGVDVIGIGSPVFHLRILSSMKVFLSSALRYVDPRTRAFIFLTYGGISSGKAFLNVLKLLRRFRIGVAGGLKVTAPHFFSGVPFPGEAALSAVEEFCAGLESNGFRVIPYDEARRLFSYQRPAVRVVYPLVKLIGHLRRLPIRIDVGKCVSCGRCVQECPVRALGIERSPVYIAGKCIHCYHCTAACPRGAFLSPAEKVQAMVRVNKELLGCEEPANAVIL